MDYLRFMFDHPHVFIVGSYIATMTLLVLVFMLLVDFYIGEDE